MDIKAKVFQQALKTLDALGCKYKIIDADGNEHGVLILAAPVEPKQRRNKFAHCYMDTLKAMQVGDTITLKPPEPGQEEAMRRAVAGTAVYVFGAGNVMTHVDGDAVHAFRRG